MTAEYFAYHQHRDYILYKELAKIETVPDFKRILEELINQEYADFDFWKQLSKQKKFKVSGFEIFLFKQMRRTLGLTFTAKFLESHEKEMIKRYEEYSKTVSDPKLKQGIQNVIDHEVYHEQELIGQIKEEKVEFISSIILGINDGLIELTGALTGFSFAINRHLIVAMAGLITGVAATLSMAASAYLQARYEHEKNPTKAGMYTGISYLVVVFLMVSPFLFLSSTLPAIILMLIIAFLVILAISFYTSVLFDRSFGGQVLEMSLFSLGVAAIALVIGLLFKHYSGVVI